MLFYFLSRIISATTAFLYPGYASYKTLSQRPASEEELEHWLMYWSVLGCIVSVEYVAEWMISWLPFYHPLKTLFLLYLALPQTSGAVYLYQSHLRPFFAAHEHEIDSALAHLKAYIYTSLQRFLRAAWDHVSGTLRQMNGGDASSAAATDPLAEQAATHTGAPPSLADPVSGPAQLAQGLWSSFGPGILASGAALLRQAQASAAQAAASASASAAAVDANANPDSSSGRAPFPEAQPYDLSDASPQVSSVPMPRADSDTRHSSSSDTSLRQRTDSQSGRGAAFEEVEVPSDMEGEGGHAAPPAPAAARRTSWFGWGGNTSKGYEHVKSE